jgi:hypothetical protein
MENNEYRILVLYFAISYFLKLAIVIISVLKEKITFREGGIFMQYHSALEMKRNIKILNNFAGKNVFPIIVFTKYKYQYNINLLLSFVETQL